MSINEDYTIAAIAAAVVMVEDEEVIAVITAIIKCMLEKGTSDFIVRNIKRNDEIHSLWTLRGRMRLMG